MKLDLGILGFVQSCICVNLFHFASSLPTSQIPSSLSYSTVPSVSAHDLCRLRVLGSTYHYLSLYYLLFPLLPRIATAMVNTLKTAAGESGISMLLTLGSVQVSL